ncbi:MAG: hypothetical protein LBC67_05990 [Spirochaetales bacterium]|jgi:hypothetical protein|nr:hypothetical protein [Spirochaetales bacterium]
MKCHFCGTEAGSEKFFRSSVCAACGKDLRICLNCAFYSAGSHHDCRESEAGDVADKERANFCDYFSPADSRTQKIAAGTGVKRDDARSKFDKLFG